MKSPVFVIPGVMQAMQASHKAIEEKLPAKLIQLVAQRASQVNGCSVCVDMHWKMLKKLGETDERMHAIAAWRHTPYFTPAERAALALTEALTRIADAPDPVPDALWAEAARHYDETQMAALIVAIANINVWNRLNVAVGQIVGEWKPA